MAPANAAACTMKLRQLVNGMAYATDEDKQQLSVSIHTAKLDALADLVEEQQGTPLLVAVSFLHEVDAIREALGDATIPYLGGGVSAKAADDIVTRWNKRRAAGPAGAPGAASRTGSTCKPAATAWRGSASRGTLKSTSN